jgi:hypothetical protein
VVRARNLSPARGSILLVVLGVLVAVALVVTQLADYALQRGALAEVRRGESASEVADQLSGSLEAAVAVLASFREVEPDLRHPAQGWGEPARLLAAWPEELSGVEVRVWDESARIGWSRVGPRSLRDLLEGVGLRRGQVEAMVDVYLDATDEDEDQRLRGRENRPNPAPDEPWVANRPLRSWAELWEIPEWREAAWTEEGELVDWARGLTEVFSLRHEESANVNTMPAKSLEWLREAGMLSSLGWWERGEIRRGEWMETIPASAGAIASDWLGTSASLLRIRASRPLGQRVFWKEVWIQSQEGEDTAGNGEDASRPGGGGGAGNEPGGHLSSWGEWEIVEFREGIEPAADEEEVEEVEGRGLVSTGFSE